MKNAFQGISSKDRDRMALEVWPQLAGCCDKCECQLLKLSVTSLRIEERFAHIVDWEFLALFFSYEYGTDWAFGDCEVDVELLPILWLGEEWG